MPSTSALSHEISFDKKLINDFIPFYEEDDETRETLTKISQLKPNGQIEMPSMQLNQSELLPYGKI